MSRLRLAVVLGVLLALVVAGAVVLLLRDGDDETALAAMSARETPFELPVPQTLGAPGSPRNTGEAFLIAEREGLRLVRLPRQDGSSCWGTAEQRNREWQLTNYTCETRFNRFPDPSSPVLVLSRGGFIPQTEFITYESFVGLAADGVRRVGVIDAQDQLVPLAAVDRNAFFGEAPGDRIKAVVALDEGGEVIWRSPPRQLPDE